MGLRFPIVMWMFSCFAPTGHFPFAHGANRAASYVLVCTCSIEIKAMVARAATPHILIADVEPTNCRVFEAKLTRDNLFRTVCVTSGATALQSALQNPFDVLLWDLRLRESAELLPRLRAVCPDAALLLMTTDDRPHLPADWSMLDVTDTLIKPFNLDTMVEKIKGALTASPSPNTGVRFDLARVGQRLTLLWEEVKCTTRVLEYRQDTILVVGGERVNAPCPVSAGQRVEVRFEGEDALYRFRSRIVRTYTAPVTCWELEKPGMIQRQQRRRNPRFPLKVPLYFEAISLEAGSRASSLEPVITQEVFGQGLTDNISIGGCALVSPCSLSVGNEVTFAFTPEHNEQIAGKGRIVRVYPSAHDPALPQQGYRVALQFHSLTPDSRKTLRLLLQKQNTTA